MGQQGSGRLGHPRGPEFGGADRRDPARRGAGLHHHRRRVEPELVNRGLVWVVDPLDGTTNFLHGLPVYAVSIAAAIDGVLEAGVILHVPLDECYRATRGAGAWLGDQRLAVSPDRGPASCADRNRLSLHRLRPAGRIPAAAGPDHAGERGCAAPRFGGTGPGRRRRGAIRGILGTTAVGVGHRGGNAAGARGGWPGDRLQRPGPGGRARRGGGRESGDTSLASKATRRHADGREGGGREAPGRRPISFWCSRLPLTQLHFPLASSVRSQHRDLEPGPGSSTEDVGGSWCRLRCQRRSAGWSSSGRRPGVRVPSVLR